MSSTATLAIRLTLAGASVAGQALGTVAGAVSKLPAALSAANQNLFFFLNNLKSVEGFISKLGQGAFEHLIVPNIKADEAVESMQFLEGSAANAKKKLRELFDVAGKADLPHAEIVQTYLALGRLGDASLTGEENLLRIAKASKFAGVSGAEMASQFADAAVILRSGKAFDRASLGLAKSGLIDPETVKELSAMADRMGAVGEAQKKVTEAETAYAQRGTMMAAQRKEKAKDLAEARRALADAKSAASGASESAMWEMVNKQVDKHTAKVKDADTTWSDLAMRINDIIGATKKMAGAALFGAMKKDLEKVRDDLQAAFDDGRLERWASAAGKVLADLYAGIKDKSIFGLTVEDILGAAEAGKLGALLKTALADTAHNFWNLMLDLATEKGPQVVQAILGKDSRLASLLGVDDAVAKQKMKSGKGTIHDYESLGWGAQADLLHKYSDSKGVPAWLGHNQIGNMVSGAFFGSATAKEQQRVMQMYASGDNSGEPRPSIDVRSDLANKGLTGLRERQMALKLFGGPGYEAPANALQSPGNYLAALRQAASNTSREIGDDPGSRKAQADEISKVLATLAPSLGDAATEATKLVDALRSGATF